jgi:hypothetical protein
VATNCLGQIRKRLGAVDVQRHAAELLPPEQRANPPSATARRHGSGWSRGNGLVTRRSGMYGGTAAAGPSLGGFGC